MITVYLAYRTAEAVTDEFDRMGEPGWIKVKEDDGYDEVTAEADAWRNFMWTCDDEALVRLVGVLMINRAEEGAPYAPEQRPLDLGGAT